MTTTEMTGVYDTLLCIPGMSEQVKIDLRVSRKQVLLLSQVIERGLSIKPGENEFTFLDVVSKESAVELASLAGDCLEKAGLTELSKKLKLLNVRKL
ncbi:hypothetical protein [Solitalea canadensis]|nr:hypothetical protein [Solitalea canadensis]